MGDIAESLDSELETILQPELDVVDLAGVEVDASDDTQQQDFVRELFEQGYMRRSCHVAQLGGQF